MDLQNSELHEDDEDENGLLVHRNEFVPNKNEEYSLKKREEGNLHFKKRSFVNSIQSYNEALQFIPFSPPLLSPSTKVENENVGICFGNRSATYYELGRPEDLRNALKDTYLALKYGYPDRLKIKILLRQVNIYLKLGNIDEAHECLKKLVSECTEISSDAELKIKQLKIQLENFSKTCKDETVTPITKPKQSTDPSLIKFNENPAFEGASDNITIHYSKDKTRYVKCKANCGFGEILFKENPFVSVLIPIFYDNYCFQCHSHLENEYFFP